MLLSRLRSSEQIFSPIRCYSLLRANVSVNATFMFSPDPTEEMARSFEPYPVKKVITLILPSVDWTVILLMG